MRPRYTRASTTTTFIRNMVQFEVKQISIVDMYRYRWHRTQIPQNTQLIRGKGCDRPPKPHAEGLFCGVACASDREFEPITPSPMARNPVVSWSIPGAPVELPSSLWRLSRLTNRVFFFFLFFRSSSTKSNKRVPVLIRTIHTGDKADYRYRRRSPKGKSLLEYNFETT